MKIGQAQQQLKIHSGQELRPKEKLQKDPRLEQSAKDLEAVFISFVLKNMEKSMSLDPNNNSNNMAGMMFSTVMSKEIAENGGVGLTDFIYKSLAEKGENPLANLRKEHSINYLNVISNFRSSDE